MGDEREDLLDQDLLRFLWGRVEFGEPRDPGGIDCLQGWRSATYRWFSLGSKLAYQHCVYHPATWGSGVGGGLGRRGGWWDDRDHPAAWITTTILSATTRLVFHGGQRNSHGHEPSKNFRAPVYHHGFGL